jgi:hypothetical protein
MDRTQCIYANGKFTGFHPVTQGVLHPYSLITFQIPFHLFSNFHADDEIYLSDSDENIESVVNQINTVLASILDWSMRNGLCLNSQKALMMAIYRHNPTSG